jgi:DNA invertase Pin-like site-specific DNA recombinase
MELVGYARVSSREERQVLDRQVDALRAAGCERIYDDHGSGASADRPGLSACLDYLRRGDVLVVLDLDRLGRRAGELIRLVNELERRGVGFRASTLLLIPQPRPATLFCRSKRHSPRWNAP